MAYFIDYTSRTKLAKSARLSPAVAGDPGSVDEGEVGVTGLQSSHRADGDGDAAQAWKKDTAGNGGSHGGLDGRDGDAVRPGDVDGEELGASQRASQPDAPRSPSLPSSPSRLSAFKENLDSPPLQASSPPTDTHTDTHTHTHAHAHAGKTPAATPRKLRRKSQSYSAAYSPPASPVLTHSYAHAQPHSLGGRRRELPGQVVQIDPAPLREKHPEPPLRAMQPRSSSRAGERGKEPVVRAPGWGPYVRDLDADAQEEAEVGPQDRHYIARMLANLQLQYEFSALSQIGTLSGYGPPFLPHANGPNSRPHDAPPPKKPSASYSLFGLLSLGGGTPTERATRDAQFVGYAWDPSTTPASPLCRYLFLRFVHAMPGLRNAKDEYWTEQIQPFFDSFAERDLSSTVERGEITKRRMLAMGIVRILGTYTSSALPAIPGPSAPARPSAGMMRLLDVLVGGAGGMDALARVVLGEGAGDKGYNAWVGVVDAGVSSGGEQAYHVLTQPLAGHHPLSLAPRPLGAFQTLASSLATLDPSNRLALPALPLSGANVRARDIQTWLRWVVVALSHPAGTIRADHAGDEALLSEARGVLERFLLPRDSAGDGKDAEALRRRVEEDDARAERRAEKWITVGKRARALRTTWVRYRGALIRGAELDETMKHVRRCPTLKELPEEYRDAEEWAMVFVAQALHYIFVGASTGAEVLNILRSFHELIPYGAIKLGLSLVNPTIAIRAIVQLVLGQPAGQLSLFQRIWSHVCNNANKHQRALIVQFRKKLGRDALCDALKAHVAEGYVARQRTKAAALERDEDIVLTIVRERGTRDDYALVERWHAAFVAAGEDAGASAETESFADLKELLAAYYRFRDREQVLAIALEPNTPRLLHASIAIFYSTIHAVANASKLSERVGDLQAFLDDLVRVASARAEPAEFVKLARRHHQQLYYFVHELAANGGDLLDPLLGWCKDGLAFLREGAPAPSTDAPRAGADVDALLARAGTPRRRAVLHEARAFKRWTALRKAQLDLELRVDLLLADADGDGDVDGAPELDKSKLWSRFLAFLPLAPGARAGFAAAAKKQQREEHRTGPGGDLEWAAWWAERETAGAAGREGIVIAQREAARAGLSPVNSHAGKAATLKRESSRASGGKQGAASLQQAQGEGHEHRRVEAELAIPPPSSEATRALLKGYVAQLKSALGGRGGRR